MKLMSWKPLALSVLALIGCRAEHAQPQLEMPPRPATHSVAVAPNDSSFLDVCRQLEAEAFTDDPRTFDPASKLLKGKKLRPLPKRLYQRYLSEPLARASAVFDPNLPMYEDVEMEAFNYAADLREGGNCVLTVVAAVEFDGLTTETHRFVLDEKGEVRSSVFLAGEWSAAECASETSSRFRGERTLDRFEVSECSNLREDGECCSDEVDSVHAVIAFSEDGMPEVIRRDSVRFVRVAEGQR